MIKPNKIQAYRESAGVTQWDVAAGAQIERSRISLIECGHVQPTPAELTAIEKVLARALATRLEQLMANREEIGAGDRA
jgi:transcriptional regulator with XRE-family HTH domain